MSGPEPLLTSLIIFRCPFHYMMTPLNPLYEQGAQSRMEPTPPHWERALQTFPDPHTCTTPIITISTLYDVHLIVSLPRHIELVHPCIFPALISWVLKCSTNICQSE